MKFFIETIGCQMNVNDSDKITDYLLKAGLEKTDDILQSDLVLLNTCSVRFSAEHKAYSFLGRLAEHKKNKPALISGVIGCMAQHAGKQIKSRFGFVNFVLGAKELDKFPHIISKFIDKKEEIGKQRVLGVSEYVTIMRGCGNFCSYCIVPYVRGSERSRDPRSIVREACDMFEAGYREVNLLGQNVDSYLYEDNAAGCKVTFANLLEMVAAVDPALRVRFATSHPKDMSDEVLYAMAKHPNICKHIHLPVQSGSNEVLERMNRKYTVETYLQRIAKIREVLPECGITTDVIVGFCGETADDFQKTLDLFRMVGYDWAFMFAYSQRPNTKAARHFADDVTAEEKERRLQQIIDLQAELSLEKHKKCLGQCYEVLVEGPSKKDPQQLSGRTSQNRVCVFPAEGHKPGDYVTVRVESCTPATLIGTIVK